MSHVTTLPATWRLHNPVWQRLTSAVVAALSRQRRAAASFVAALDGQAGPGSAPGALNGAWRRSRQQSRMLDEQAAVRSLDRRVRRDLGLHADDAPWRDVPASVYEHMRW
jgi:hypothetical protein